MENIEKKNLPCYCPINFSKADNPRICSLCLGDILEIKEIKKKKNEKN